MKILIIRPLTGRTSFELGGYCRNALEKLGHTADTFEYIDNRISCRISILEGVEKAFVKDKLLRRVNKFKPELILVIKGEHIFPMTIAFLKRLRIPLVNYWIDDPYRLEISRKLSPLYDYFFTNDAGSVDVHKQAGCPNVGFLTFGCDTDTHKKIILSGHDYEEYKSDICFCGSISQERLEILSSLVDFDIKIWAQRYVYHFQKDFSITKKPVLPESPLYEKFTGRPVWGEELVKVYNASKIVVNIHSPQTSPNMRDFEAAGCGTFLLTDRAKGLDKMFEAGKEIVCYSNTEQLREAVLFYLRDFEKRKDIASRGQKRAVSNHTYTQRMQEMLAFISV